MKGLLWSKNRKSSTASASSSSTSTPHKTTTASTALSSSPSSSSQTIRNSTSGASPYMHSYHHHGQGHSHHRGEDNNRDKRKSSVFPPSKQYTSTSSSQVNLGMYHSDTNTRSSRSIASTLKDDSPSVCSEDEISNSSSQKSNAQDETPIAYKKSAHSKDSLLPSRSSSLSPPQSRCSTGTTLEKSLNTSGISNNSGTNNNNSNNNNDNEQKQRNVIHLNSENYDTTVFKTGWVNKSHGQTVATNYNSSMTAPSSSSSSSSQNLRNDAYSRNRESRFYGNDGSSLKNDDSSSTTATNSGNDVASARSSMAIDPQMLVPDYRLYRAQLERLRSQPLQKWFE